MREIKEEMASISRQEEEHKKRKIDAVSNCCQASQLPSVINFVILLTVSTHCQACKC